MHLEKRPKLINLIHENQYYCKEQSITQFKKAINYLTVAEEVLGDNKLAEKIATGCKSVFLQKMALCVIYTKLEFPQRVIKAVLEISENRTYTKYIRKHEFYFKSDDAYNSIYQNLANYLLPL